MNTIPYDCAVQMLQHQEQHLQWVEKMQLQGDLALIAGDFAAYAKNTKRLLNNPLSTSAELQKEDTLPVNASAVTLPPVTTPSCYGRRAADIISAVYDCGCTRAYSVFSLQNELPGLPLLKAKSSPIKRKGMPEIDYLLEQGGEQCFKAAKANADKPDYKALMGICYLRGLGVSVNSEEALKCFLSVAKQSPLAQFCIGICYEEGIECPKSFAQAGKWYYIAAKNGCWQAASLLFQKLEVFSKDKKSIRASQPYKRQWLELIKGYADERNSAAQNLLGVLYENGHGVDKSQEEAISWYKKAATQGNVRAQYNIGTIYEYGQGLPKDIDKAREWYCKAIEQGYELAKEQLKKLK